MRTWSDVYWANRGKHGISIAIWMADKWEAKQKNGKPAPAATKKEA